MFARGGFSVAGPVLLVLAVTFSQIAPPQSLRVGEKWLLPDNDDAPFCWRCGDNCGRSRGWRWHYWSLSRGSGRWPMDWFGCCRRRRSTASPMRRFSAAFACVACNIPNFKRCRGWHVQGRFLFVRAFLPSCTRCTNRCVQQTAISYTLVVWKEFWSFSYAFATHLSKAAKELTV